MQLTSGLDAASAPAADRQARPCGASNVAPSPRCSARGASVAYSLIDCIHAPVTPPGQRCSGAGPRLARSPRRLAVTNRRRRSRQCRPSSCDRASRERGPSRRAQLMSNAVNACTGPRARSEPATSRASTAAVAGSRIHWEPVVGLPARETARVCDTLSCSGGEGGWCDGASASEFAREPRPFTCSGSFARARRDRGGGAELVVAWGRAPAQLSALARAMGGWAGRCAYHARRRLIGTRAAGGPTSAA